MSITRGSFSFSLMKNGRTVITFCMVITLVLHSECWEESEQILPKPVIGALFDDNGSMRKAFSLAVNTVNKCMYDHQFCEKVHPTDPKINKHLFHQVQFTTMTALFDNDIFSFREHFTKLAGIDYRDDLSPIRNENGLSFLIGPHKSIVSLYVQGLCELNNLPHAIVRREANGEHSSSKTINFYPDMETLANVFLDLIKALKWKTFTILYENTDYFLSLHKILKMYPDFENSVYGIKLTSRGSNYSGPLLQAKKIEHKNFLLDCRFDILNDVLTQIQEVGMMTEDYSYIITTLDLHAIDWRQYQYSNVTIKGFQLMDLTKPFIRDFLTDYLDFFEIETVDQFRLKDALVFDAVMMFSHAYKDLNYLSGPLSSARFSKDFDRRSFPWKQGLSLRNYLLYTEIKGLTGLVAIDGDGARRRFKLDLMELRQTGLTANAEWNFEDGFVNFRYEEPKKKPHYRVLITDNRPYAMKVNHSKGITGNDRYEGLVVDIIKELSLDLDFTYTLIMHKDRNNGECNFIKIGNQNETKCTSCDGVTGAVFNGEVDMAISDLTMTENRAKCVQFSTPFYNLGITLLMKKPQNEVTLFAFSAPFHTDVWLYTLLCILLVSTVLFINARLSPSEWTNPYPCIEEPVELQNQFTFNNAMWYVMGAILQQGSEIAPIGLSNRILGSTWGFFCLIICNTYIANLAVNLVSKTPERVISDYKQLTQHPEIKFGAKVNGSTAKYFQNSNNEYHRKLYKIMTECEDCMANENEDGVEYTRSNTTQYAFFMESSTVKYVIKQYCELEEVGKLIDQKSYAIAYLKNFTAHQQISASLSRMEESSLLAGLRNKWWNEKGNKCSDDSKSTQEPSSEAIPMTEEQLRGAFVVLAVGLVFSSIVTIWVSCREIRSMAKTEKVNFIETAKVEIKNMISKSVKPVLLKQRSTETNLTEASCDWTTSTLA